MRSYIRQHLEVDDEELPNTILDVYLRDAFERTLAADNRWPKHEATWELTRLVDEDSVALPPECLLPSIMSVKDVDRGYRLAQMTHENAEDSFSTINGPATGLPIYYSLWARRLYLWPNPEASVEYPLLMRGYSQPVWSAEASAVPALHESLHLAMCYYAMSLAYAAQEDEILEGVYLSRWDRDVRQQVKMLLQPPTHRPLVLHGGSAVGGVPSYVIVPPAEEP